MNFEEDVNGMLGFFQAKSQFYPDLDNLLRQRVIEHFGKATAQPALKTAKRGAGTKPEAIDEEAQEN